MQEILNLIYLNLRSVIYLQLYTTVFTLAIN